MTRKRRRLWVVLFIWMALLLGTLATSWNVVIVQDYRRMLELARQVSASASISIPPLPALSLLMGWLGFGAAMATIILFFLKILKEMRLNQQQSEFLATISHELKTPIASIELSSSLIREGLREGDLSPEEIEKLWTAHNAELTRLQEEVNTLLEAARFQTSSVRPETFPMPLEPWLKSSIQRWERILGPKARLQREGETLNGKAEIDLKSLSLITDNLIDNARKFSKGSPDVVVSTRRVTSPIPWKKSRWVIEFTDRGWGFDPADSRRIFSRFVRAQTDAPYPIPGSGLGLYLAESASRALGLKLWGESEGKGCGARFVLEGREIG